MGRVALDTLIRRSLDNMGDVHPAVKDKTLYILHKAYEEGINVQISSGLRTFAEQAKLYAKGRSAPGNIVTNAEPGESVHNYGLAIDYFLTTWDGSTAVWNVTDDWRRVAEIGKTLGFEWGGDWSGFVDYPHLQLTGGLNWRDLQAGRRPSDDLLNKGVMRQGHSGWSVALLQKDLRKLGYSIEVDGLFGPATDKALKGFQKAHSLIVDGFYGPMTQVTMERSLKRYHAVSNKEDEELENMKQTGFKDVSPDHVLADEIKKAKVLGITKGVGNDKFAPEDTMTRAEGAAFAVRSYEKAFEDAKKYFEENK